LLASGQLPSTVDDNTAGSALDPETLARWTKYLADPEKQHPFLKDWYAATTQDQRAKAATQFQAQVLAVIAEKAHVDDENHVRLGLNPTRNDLSKANLVSLDRAKFGLWEDILGDHGVLHWGDSKKEEANIDRFLSGVWRSHLTQLRAQLAALKKDLPPAYPVLQTIADKEKPEEQHVWIRGNQNNPGDLAPPHFLAILSAAEPEPFQRGKERLELAEAIASPTNPLTARVIVNRVWQQHFGYGLVRTPSNFGSQGDRPDHHHALAQSHAIAVVDVEQKVYGAHDAVEIGSLDRHFAPTLCPHAEKYGPVAFPAQVSQPEFFAQRRVQLQLHAQAQDLFDLTAVRLKVEQNQLVAGIE